MRGGRDRLQDPDARLRLGQAVAQVDRLVLLGDAIEFRQGPVRDALVAAAPVLSELGEALAPGREVVVVAGNHDHCLVEGWLRRRAAAGPPQPLGLQSEVDWWGDEPLAAVAEMLGRGGARVRAAYPGLWLRDDVWATHGHYLDRHTTVPLFERIGVGAVARATGRPVEDAHAAEDYEAVLAPLYALIHEVAQSAGVGTPSPGASARAWQVLGRGFRRGTLRQRGLVLGAAGAVALLNRAGIGPVRTDLSAGELRRAALRAFGEVLVALGVDCRYAVFGHTHRAGTLPSDNTREWWAPTGARLVNTGCWVHEPIFLGARPEQSPYRAGFAVLVEPGERPPQLVNLLEERVPPPAPARA
jgi:hypothetical protein